MAKRLRKYAESIGAVNQNGRVNWQAVAESLAKKYEPELLEGEPGPRVGAPKKVGDARDDCWLAIEIEYVKTSDQLSSIEQACEKISKNKFIEFLTNVKKVEFSPEVEKVKSVTLTNPWKGIEAGTLKRRYQRWLAAEKNATTK